MAANDDRHGTGLWSTFMAYMAKGEYDIDWAGSLHLPGGADIEPDQW